MAAMSDDADAPQPPAQSTALRPWQRNGPSPWPSGRGKGHPNKFSKAFLHDVSKKWAQHGSDVLEQVRHSDPSTFLRVCASLIPKELLVVTHSTTPVANLSQQELEAILVEDISVVERLRAALLPLIDRVHDQGLRDEMHRVLADG
jgi:hypothetical protein